MNANERKCNEEVALRAYTTAKRVVGARKSVPTAAGHCGRKPTLILRRAGTSLTFALALLASEIGHAQAATEQARSADSFVDSIGICTHWSYPDTPYGFAYEGVRQKLVASGIRHIRDSLNPHSEELARAGIRTTAGLDMDNNEDGSEATIQKLVQRVKTANASFPVVEAIEGPNEPDYFWAGFKKSYKGQGHQGGDKGIIAGVIAFQKDLYAALKADNATRALPVVGPSLGKTYGYDTRSPFGKGTLAQAVDYGNFHPYCGGNPFSQRWSYDTIEWYYGQGNFPSANLDEFPFAFDVYAPPFAPKPMMATETGYSTDRGGPSEAAHAKYMPRLFCEYFRKGVARAFSYELIDEFEDKAQTNREAHFGLLRRDLTPKPAYDAVKNLIGILSEKGVAPAFRPGALDYALQVTPQPGYDKTQFVHHLLLQKSDGAFYLVLWHEISDEDTKTTPHRQITPPDMPATITLPPDIRAAALYVPNESALSKPVVIANHSITVSVPDKVIILRLSRK